MHVLLLEDDPLIASNLYEFLSGRGHACDYAHSIATARRLLAEQVFDAAVIDRSLPDGDGLDLVRQRRQQGDSLPVLVLTARDALADKLAGFSAGSDDYLVKPFALQEVEARLLALTRRAPRRRDVGCSCVGQAVFDAAAQELTVAGVVCPLPPRALRLAALLFAHPARVFSRSELEIALWGAEQETSDSLRQLILTLRRGLGDQAGVRLVTRHGLGVQLVAD